MIVLLWLERNWCSGQQIKWKTIILTKNPTEVKKTWWQNSIWWKADFLFCNAHLSLHWPCFYDALVSNSL